MKRIALLAAIVSGFLLLVGANAAFAASDPGCTALGGNDTGPGTTCTLSGTHTVNGTFTLSETLDLSAGAQIVTGAPGITIHITSGDFVMEIGALIDGNVAGACNVLRFGAPINVNLDAGNMDLQTGSIIRSDSCSGGPIVLTTKDSFTANIDGLVESVGSLTGTGGPNQHPGGGTIKIVAGCALTVSDTGIVSSRGKDPGADLVHLEGCTVVINGLVESTGPGHVLPQSPPNHCNLQPEHVPGGHPSTFFTACVEIWSGSSVLIDDSATHNGEINADTGQSGGTNGRGWIDIYARQDITIKGMVDPLIDPSAPPNGGGCSGHVNNLSGAHPGCGPNDHYAVHANGGVGVNTDDGGLITIVSQSGKVITSDQAVQAASTSGGGDGGDVRIEAAGNIEFGTASIQAKGATTATGAGGHIGTMLMPVRSYAGAVNGGTPGELNAAGGAAPGNGTVVLEACAGVPSTTYTGTATPPLTSLTSCTATQPTLPGFVDLPAGSCFQQFCSLRASKSGVKFLDKNGNHQRDEGEPGLPGWTIQIFDSSNNNTQVGSTTTGSDGSYLFTNLLPGSYTVCEVPQPENGFTQTCPQTNLDCDLETMSTASCASLTGGGIGYAVTLEAGQNETGNDFGNTQNANISGTKFNDVNVSATKDAGEPGLSGWVIKIFAGSTPVDTQTTIGSGFYEFNVLPGSYTVCEVPLSGWAQTCPTSGLDCANTVTSTTTTCASLVTGGGIGYAITLQAGDNTTRDFGNHNTNPANNSYSLSMEPGSLTRGKTSPLTATFNNAPTSASSITSLTLTVPSGSGWTITAADGTGGSVAGLGTGTITVTSISPAVLPGGSLSVALQVSVPCGATDGTWDSSVSGFTLSGSNPSTNATGVCALKFVQPPPPSVISGVPFSVQVEALDGNSDPIPTFTGPVTLTLNTVSGFFTGFDQIPQPPSGGIVTIDVTITGAGQFTLTASTTSTGFAFARAARKLPVAKSYGEGSAIADVTSEQFTVSASGTIDCGDTLDPAFTNPDELGSTEPGFAAGSRGTSNKDGSECVLVNYAFINTILSDNTVLLQWDTNGQPGAAFQYTVTWKPEYVDATTGMPNRVTRVAWFVSGVLTTPVPGRACLSPDLPSPFGTLDAAVSAGDSVIPVTASATLPATPFPIEIGNERLTVTDVAGTSWTVDRGVGGTTAAAHDAGVFVMSTPLPLDGSGIQMRMCIAKEGWSAFSPGPDPGTPDCPTGTAAGAPTTPTACVLYTTTVYDIGDGFVIRNP